MLDEETRQQLNRFAKLLESTSDEEAVDRIRDEIVASFSEEKIRELQQNFAAQLIYRDYRNATLDGEHYLLLLMGLPTVNLLDGVGYWSKPEERTAVFEGLVEAFRPCRNWLIRDCDNPSRPEYRLRQHWPLKAILEKLR
ncbi:MULTISPECIES: hypothetical protein [Hyphobacterium]|uniref:Uncharacterized protein n=1 Tax=Hyphobacterium vulgare TaxID=1736751 RepID=A0ABV7A0R1_9PROT